MACMSRARVERLFFVTIAAIMERAIRFSPSTLARRTLLIGMLIAFAVMFFVRVQLMTHYTLNMGGVDQNVVLGTLRIMQGEALYGDPEAPPFPVVQYSPAFFYIHVWACMLAGVDASDVQGVYVTGRVISLLMNLITCWLIVLVCRRMGMAWYIAIAAGAFLFTSLTDMYFLRPDSLYLLFFWCHVVVVVSSIREGVIHWNGKVVLWCSLFAVLALFSKQTGLIVPVMTGGFMLFQGRWMALLKFSLACALWSGLFLAGLFLVNEPYAVYQNVVLGNVNGTDIAHLIEHLTNRYGLPITIWLLVGVAVSIHALRGKEKQLPGYIAFAMLVTLIWALFTAMKRGSNSNYYTESQMLTVVLCLMLVLEQGRQQWKHVLWIFVLLFLPFVSLLRSAMFLNATMITKYRADEPSVYYTDREVARRIREHGLAPEEYVFVMNRGFSEMFLSPHTLWNAKCIVLVSDEYLAFDLTEFYSMAKNGRMKYVITDRSETTLGFYGQRFDDFVPLFEVDGRAVHVHRNALDDPAP